MLPDWVSNPGPLTYESGALPITNWYGTEVGYVVWYKILHIPLTIPHTIHMHKFHKRYILKLTFPMVNPPQYEPVHNKAYK